MSCCSCTCTLPPPFPLYEFSKKTLTLSTTHGSTYCEIYYPSHYTYSQLTSIPNDSTEILLMVHGLGGSCRHWQESDIPSYLAQNNAIVITYDLYSHGKSQILSNSTTPHTTELFVLQLYEMIHHPDFLLSHYHRRFHLLGFSLGGWIVLNYLIKYHKLPTQPCCSVNHCINKVIFQSPWDGYVPSALRGLMHIPGLLRLCRPTDMAYINDYQALKHVLLYADKEKQFQTCCEEFVELIENHDQAKANALLSGPNSGKSSPQVPSSPTVSGVGGLGIGRSTVRVPSTTNGDPSSSSLSHNTNSNLITDSLITIENHLLQNYELYHTASEILFLSGRSEPLFTAVCNSIRNKIFAAQLEKFDNQTQEVINAEGAGEAKPLTGTQEKDKVKGRKKKTKTKTKYDPNYIELERRFPQRICKRADHMTFIHETNKTVGQYYRDTIGEFLFPKFHLDVIIDPQHNPQHK